MQYLIGPRKVFWQTIQLIFGTRYVRNISKYLSIMWNISDEFPDLMQLVGQVLHLIQNQSFVTNKVNIIKLSRVSTLRKIYLETLQEKKFYVKIYQISRTFLWKFEKCSFYKNFVKKYLNKIFVQVNILFCYICQKSLTLKFDVKLVLKIESYNFSWYFNIIERYFTRFVR